MRWALLPSRNFPTSERFRSWSGRTERHHAPVDQARLGWGVHLHLAAAYPHEPWVEHLDWLHPLFPERLEISGGRMHLSDRPGLGVSLTEQSRAWTVDSVRVDAPRSS
jgi:hypothetical protein